jgi:RNA 2',3'-cyclic 3'-phosphodiesterase
MTRKVVRYYRILKYALWNFSKRQLNKNDGTTYMRTFISINLTDDIHQSISKMQNRLDSDAIGIRWTRAENCHLTLKFLGAIQEEIIEPLSNALAKASLTIQPFTAELKGIGQFPSRNPLSVLWIGVDQGNQEMRDLEQSIRKPILESGIKFDKKTFSPHLTIGRGRRGQKAQLNDLDSYANLSVGTIEVDSFYLMKSVLQQSGPVYNVVKRFPLGA